MIIYEANNNQPERYSICTGAKGWACQVFTKNKPQLLECMVKKTIQAAGHEIL
jgi:hypothetical protein